MVGVSWVPKIGTASNPPHAGGVCDHRRVVRGSKTLPDGTYSLNAVLITQRTGAIRLSSGVVSLTVTHELGHSFGAEHDDKWPNRFDCLPGAQTKHGNYIMASTVPMLTQSHNWMFSMCSRELIMPIMMDGRRTRCLRTRGTPYCGNAVIESGEQCDCGTSYTCGVIDKCCVPRSIGRAFGRHNACKLKGSCSPRVSLCCTNGCMTADAGVICRQKSNCSSESRCDGLSPSCPVPQFADDGTPCADGQGKCEAGVCSVSPCDQAGLVDCRCRRPLNHACSVCCRCSTAPKDACVPAQWLNVADHSYSLLLQPGSACLDRGRCNSDGRCVIGT